MNFDTEMFQDEILPTDTRLAGWASLICHLDVKTPLRNPICISNKHIKGSPLRKGVFTVYEKKYWPGDSIGDHLDFALRYEIFDLLCIKNIMAALPKNEILNFVKTAPMGKQTRKVWYLYESLTGEELDLDDLSGITVTNLLDDKLYITNTQGDISKRHRVRDNLLGNFNFCPIIRRTQKIQDAISERLSEKTQKIVGRVSNQLLARAASFLLLADTQASFAIEGETPPRNRLERWGKAVSEAGRNPLSEVEITRLHRILIEDNRFVPVGIREEEVFLGERDYQNNPLPEFIGAKHTDLKMLIDDFLELDKKLLKSKVNPVLQAAVLAFGFVYIHPLADGNGRLHRYILHHVLAQRGFTPKGIIFPISSEMQERIEEYKQTLINHSGPLMEHIEWEPNEKNNVSVLNDTSDLYRFFDCTEAAEFIFSCVKQTVEKTLPKEIDFLQRHDSALQKIMNFIEMPDQLARQFILFARQNNGKLGKKRHKNEFASLTDKEVKELEEIFRNEFDGFDY